MIKCPNCLNDDPSMISTLNTNIKLSSLKDIRIWTYLFCESCSKHWLYIPSPKLVDEE